MNRLFLPRPKQWYANIEAEKLMLYSDPDVKDLVRVVSEKYKVKPEQVIMTNGSDEVLNFAFMAYCDDKRPAIFADLTYGFYKVFAQINGVPYKEIPLKEDFTLDVKDYVEADGTVFIANPNAPTGINLPLQEIEKILASNPNRIVVIDEAYVDFGGESAVKLIDKYDNLHSIYLLPIIKPMNVDERTQYQNAMSAPGIQPTRAVPTPVNYRIQIRRA